MDASPSRRSARRLLPLIAGVCAIALAAGCSGAEPAASPAPEASPSGTAQGVATRDTAELENAYKSVINDVLPSVVQIDASDSLGSGIVYDDKGHIVTNAHVIGDEKTFKVTVATGEAVLNASLVSSYPEQDLAVIKLDDVPDGLKPAKFGDAEKVEVGQIVMAMGSPLGLSSSVTQGIVSALGRTVSESRAGGGTGATIANMVQTSAAINPGNSGGALVNLSSEVIGIPTLAATDPQMGDSAAPGIGFAIPVSMVRTVADQIIKDGRVTDSGRAALNITGRTVVDDSYRPAGVALVSVERDGAADEAGLRAGDIITKIGDTAVTTITSLSEALAGDQPGDKVTVTYTAGRRQQDGRGHARGDLSPAGGKGGTGVPVPPFLAALKPQPSSAVGLQAHRAVDLGESSNSVTWSAPPSRSSFQNSPIQDSASPWVVNSSGCTAGSISVPSDFSNRHVHAMCASVAHPLHPVAARSVAGRAPGAATREDHGVELTLLGTGAPDGLPRPSCPCAACATARGPWARAATALLIDGALLLDLTPGAVFAAARAGHSLGACARCC